MRAVIGVRIPRGEDGMPLTGLAQDVVHEVSQSEAHELLQAERRVLDEIAKILAPAFAEHMQKKQSGKL